METFGFSDIVGPIMVGPSSSHTAGALRIARMARSLLATEPMRAAFTLYGSFAHTQSGHGTDKALVAGLLGLAPDDLGVRDSFDVRAVRETVDCINGRVVAEYAAYRQIEIDFVYEMFCVVIFGLVGLVKLNPDVSDETLMKVIEQTLRLDMEPLEPPGSDSANGE